MALIANSSPSILQLTTISNPIRDANSSSCTNLRFFVVRSRRLRWNCRKVLRFFRVTAAQDSSENSENEVSDVVVDSGGTNSEKKLIGSFRQVVAAMPPSVKGSLSAKVVIGLSLVVAIIVAVVRRIAIKKNDHRHHGSVAELVRRGQIRSDRRTISKPMKYDDPFNNPFMKVDKGSSTVEMFGKVYRLAPVTLTREEQSVHQKRRSRAYQWKRPTVFLKEGDSIPPDVDPDTVRWIPANHPFATTVSDIDEDLAQNNVYQHDGVPFRVKAEHEAMQKKLQSLQSDQRLGEVAMNTDSMLEFERPFRLKSNHNSEQRDSNSDH